MENSTIKQNKDIMFAFGIIITIIGVFFIPSSNHIHNLFGIFMLIIGFALMFHERIKKEE